MSDEDVLSKISTDKLMEELVRRRNARRAREESQKPIENCDECANFRVWSKRGECPDDYNPCGKGHKMRFRMPRDENPHDPDYGYYRIVCADREAIPPPAPPAPTPRPPRTRPVLVKP